MSTLKVSTISPLGTDATNTITIGSAGDTIAGVATNTPSFFVVKTSDQSASGGGEQVKVTFDTEVIDTDSAFDIDNSKFVVPTGLGGVYFVGGLLRYEGTNGTLDQSQILFYKNGERHYQSQIQTSSNNLKNGQIYAACMLNCSAGDYLEMYGAIDGSSTAFGGASDKNNQTYFMGYKLIGA